ncbi:MAG: o-succinylbenzoate synthase, partial [Chloroflexia bacterium]|nr:o-succinylbenzoate synthase [Chloroflexia bacterium]
MRLTKIAVHLVELELPVPFTTSFGTYTRLSRPFVVLETADGRRG